MYPASGRLPLQETRRAARSLNDTPCLSGVLRALYVAVAVMLAMVAVLFTAPSTARAHGDLDQAIASAEEAEFEAALAGFKRALDSGTLTRDELVTLLSERSFVLHALRQRRALARDLATLAMIEPGHDLGRRAPPELVSAFQEATSRQGAAATIRASCAPSRTGLRVTTSVSGLSDPSLAQVKIRTRREQGTETANDASEVAVPAGPGESLAYSAELVGLGNVVLTRDGSASAPKMCELPDLGEPPVAVAGTAREDGKNRKLWWWLGAGSVVAITAVTVGLVVANKNDEPSGDTAVGRPIVSFK